MSAGEVSRGEAPAQAEQCEDDETKTSVTENDLQASQQRPVTQPPGRVARTITAHYVSGTSRYAGC